MNFNTALLHQNAQPDAATGATLPPIQQSSAFAQSSPEQLEKVFRNQAPGFAYTRAGNPSIAAFEQRINGLEGGIGAVACASGMAAVTMSLLNILQSGDEIIVGAGLFGGTLDLFRDLEGLGIRTVYVPHVSAETLEPCITERTKAVFAELIGNPALDIVDVQAVSQLLHGRGIPFLLDCTTATPYLVKPFALGADIVIHSTSKYINGSGSAISGVIVDGGKFKWDVKRYPALAEYAKFGPFAYLARLRNGMWRNVGACLAPMNAFLNTIGLETLGLRMERICENAQRLAEFLETCPGVTVNYPGLPSNPYYPLVQSQFHGRAGGILTIRAGSKESAFQLLNRLHYALNATNIGDVRTLAIHPSSTIYIHSDEAQQEAAGVYNDTIRISVGIEDIDDLIEDFRQALQLQ